ncbi:MULTISPECIES: XdhC family protein [Ferrimicrobium]|jgi:xanthine dehydrogenase accessory factor|uniref:XdhC family protein n=1 Tax=Ferrimicrobium acidiphilum TaxID=121039 RepID=A0ABV3XYF1_9ACTN|nr:XdhC family protein [Ferrimicrobium sp.]MCL5973105.1 XdhC family protein [Actinomycetota bacterium]
MTFDELSSLLDATLSPEAPVVRLFEITGFGGGDRASDFMVIAGSRPIGSVLTPQLGLQIVAQDTSTLPRSLVGEIGDPEAVANGLACGGTVRVIVHPWSWVSKMTEHLRARRPFALVTEVDAEARPTSVTVIGLGDRGGSRAVDTALELLEHGRAGVTVVELEGQRVHVQCFVPSSRVVVIGGGALASALRHQGEMLGFEVVEFQGDVPQLGRADAVVVLDHDHDRVTPLLCHLLGNTEVAYIGSLGSRGTQQERRRRLIDGGVGDHVERVYGPAGLDIGSRTTAETAMAIIAEFVSVVRGRSGRSLRAVDGPING